MISLERMKEIYDRVVNVGVVLTAFGEKLPTKTIEDYVRRYKQHISGQKKEPTITLFDIETDYMENATWGLWKQNIHIGQILRDWSMISWASENLLTGEKNSGAVTPEESILRNDETITRKLWNIIDKSDIIIAHNLKKFDRKKMNTCFLKYRLGVPSPYQMIDTLQIARHNFAISSNKLDYLAKVLGHPMKHDTGFKLWRECDGIDAIIKTELKTKRNKILKTTTYDKKIILDALDKMDKYCQNDVTVLKNVYLDIRAWDTRHPNIAMYGECQDGKCSICGSTNLVSATKDYRTPVSVYETYTCQDCGTHNHSRFAEKRSKKLLRGCAR